MPLLKSGCLLQITHVKNDNLKKLTPIIKIIFLPQCIIQEQVLLLVLLLLFKKGCAAAQPAAVQCSVRTLHTTRPGLLLQAASLLSNHWVRLLLSSAGGLSKALSCLPLNAGGLFWVRAGFLQYSTTTSKWFTTNTFSTSNKAQQQGSTRPPSSRVVVLHMYHVVQEQRRVGAQYTMRGQE